MSESIILVGLFVIVACISYVEGYLAGRRVR